MEETQKPRYESGCDSPTSFYSHLTSSLSTNRRFVNRKSQNTANNNQILAAVIAHLHDATSDPIRVRIPYFNFLSPKTCRNLDKSSFKMGHTIEHTRLAWFLVPLKLANDAKGSLIRLHVWSSRNCMTSQTCGGRKHALTFLVFPSVKFCEIIFVSGFLLFNQKYEIVRFLRIL